MLPIVDYGSIAIVIPKVMSVGSVVENRGKIGFEVYLNGMEEPLVIGFNTLKEAEEARNELIAIIAQYYYVSELGPDFEMDEVLDYVDRENDSDDDNKNGH